MNATLVPEPPVFKPLNCVMKRLALCHVFRYLANKTMQNSESTQPYRLLKKQQDTAELRELVRNLASA